MELNRECLDYDGVGNYGRFPKIDKKVKKSLYMSIFIRIFEYKIKRY